MRVLISVDIEGVAGVSRPEQCTPGNEDYRLARRLMTEEANAAVEGAFEGGATEVIVADAHGSFGNLLPDLLDERARLAHGKPRPFGMLEGIQRQPGAVMLIGYHAMAGARGVLAHTVRGTAFHRVWIQDRPAGEAALYGLLAGEYGVPVVMASGDDAFAAETQAWLPRTRFAVVKEAAANRAAFSLSPAKARALIREEARQSLGETVDPLDLGSSIVCRVEAKTAALADLFALLPGARRVEPLMLEFKGTPGEVVRVISLWSAAAASL